MNELFKQFRAYQKTTAFYTQIGTRLYLEDAPEGTDLPYAVWSFPYGFTFKDLAGSRDETITAQLDIYAESESVFLALFDQAQTDFDGCSFAVSGHELVGFQRDSYRRIKEDGVKRYIIEHKIQIGETS